MGRSLVEKVIVPALEALKDKNEQMWLGVTVATLLVLLFGPGGVTTGSQATNTSGHYMPTGVFAKANSNTSVVQPGPKSLDPVDKRPINLPQVEPEAPMLDEGDPAKAKPTTPVVEPGPKQPKPVGPLSEFKLQEEPKPAMPR